MTKSISTKAGFGFVVIASFLFGTTGTAQILANQSTSGLYVGAARQVVGGVSLVILAITLGQRDLFKYLLSKSGILAATGTLIYQVTFFIGITNNGVATGTLVALGSAPIFTALLSRILLGEQIRKSQIQIYFLVFSGIWLLMLGFTIQLTLTSGMLMSLAAGLGYAIYTVNAKSLIVSGANPTTALAVAFGGAVPIALLILLLGDSKWLFTSSGFGLALYLGLVPTALAYYFFGKGLSVLPAATVATITLIEPVVAAVFALSLLNETFTVAKVLGMLIVLTGILALNRVENRKSG